MLQLPAVCEGCRSVMLKPAGGAEANCITCGGNVRVVPGCCYRGAEAAQFAELAHLVERHNLSLSDAQLLAFRAQEAQGGARRAFMDAVDRRAPTLADWLAKCGHERHRAAVQMLATIFGAMASCPLH